MFSQVLRRLGFTIYTIIAISIISFILIQLPLGDFARRYIAESREMGEGLSVEDKKALRELYGIDQPLYIQYYAWMRGMLRGDFGLSFQYQRLVIDVIGEKLVLTMVVSFASMMLNWMLAIPIGIYSAVRQHSIGDYISASAECFTPTQQGHKITVMIQRPRRL
jgi:peptide/nickel transport system permease protein